MYVCMYIYIYIYKYTRIYSYTSFPSEPGKTTKKSLQSLSEAILEYGKRDLSGADFPPRPRRPRDSSAPNSLAHEIGTPDPN